ncbi:MAG: oxidoreductase, molybdopterin-binding [Myxococcaceae bacterium]|nr:oxidoreductase, molybdopterin-binding [Myxococcaceae bacterium]
MPSQKPEPDKSNPPYSDSASLHAALTRGEARVEPARWGGGLPAEFGVAPHVRLGKRWVHVLWAAACGFALLLTAVSLPGGLPGWARVCHLLNLFLMTFILRSGVEILSDHPRLYWSRHWTPGTEWLRFRPPVPDSPTWTAKQESVSLLKHLGLPGIRHSVGLARWWHFGTDVLWLANGLVFYVLLFATDQWQRLVPRSSDIFPHAMSMVLQYLSLEWQTSCPRYSTSCIIDGMLAGRMKHDVAGVEKCSNVGVLAGKERVPRRTQLDLSVS